MKKQRVIPLTRFALLERLSNDPSWSGEGRAYCARFFRNLAVWRHQQYRDRLNRLKECYLPFSPDRDTLRVLKYSETEKAELQEALIKEVSVLLQRANYQRITEDDLNHIFAAQSPHGLDLKVDLSEFEAVLLFSRGAATESRERRTPGSLYLRKETFELELYQRLFLLLKLKPEPVRIRDNHIGTRR